MDGDSRCSGKVEFFAKAKWVDVCGYAWDLRDAAVVCKELDCGDALEVKTDYQSGITSQTLWTPLFDCNGSESTLVQCPNKEIARLLCPKGYAGVICSGKFYIFIFILFKKKCRNQLKAAKIKSGGL